MNQSTTFNNPKLSLDTKNNDRNYDDSYGFVSRFGFHLVLVGVKLMKFR